MINYKNDRIREVINTVLMTKLTFSRTALLLFSTFTILAKSPMLDSNSKNRFQISLKSKSIVGKKTQCLKLKLYIFFNLLFIRKKHL